ncbi:hypothetical protein ERJ75_001245400 [Trypanosoma vivax]|nr:hypothetical protein ERJ75_001245400 [Trypanosoma vivax]
MKNWPEQRVPDNFRFTEEQRFKTKAIPRDVGKIPRDFVLSILYRHQPCEVSGLWEHCTNDPGIVLDSKRHLREVLKQARDEGFVTFERDTISNEWLCFITRERYEDVRRIAGAAAAATATSPSLRGSSAVEASACTEKYMEMSAEDKKTHARRLEEEVAATTRHLRTFHQREIDYLPYTDLNGKVNFMWWYETREVQAKMDETLPASAGTSLDDPSNPGTARLESQT